MAYEPVRSIAGPFLIIYSFKRVKDQINISNSKLNKTIIENVNGLARLKFWFRLYLDSNFWGFDYHRDEQWIKTKRSAISCLTTFLQIQYSNVHLRFPGPILSYLTPLFLITKHSPSLRLASRSNPCPLFSNCMRRDVTYVSFCLTTFHKKKQLYTTQSNQDLQFDSD